MVCENMGQGLDKVALRHVRNRLERLKKSITDVDEVRQDFGVIVEGERNGIVSTIVFSQ